MNKTQNIVEINVEILNETDLDIFISDGDKEVWIPKSQIIEPSDGEYMVGDIMLTITIPEWLAIEKGFV